MTPTLHSSPRRVGVAACGLALLVHGYRLLLRPLIGNRCRFEPTCSTYALEALHCHGAAAGSYLAVRRLMRCHPWCEAGFDPVPAERPSLFVDLVRRADRSSTSSQPKTLP
jgi:putative membrane protein insertion efficiency factor